jgi:hypothetical protein
MDLRSLGYGAAVLVVAASLAGCGQYPPPGPLVYGPCGHDAHTEAYPHNPDDKKAYGCKSDDDGYLESSGQGDQAMN